jgi:glycosyltransferase involved in cell wall biosynthesis
MKIGFQGWFLNQPYTGIGQYCINLLTAMAKADKSVEWVVVVPEKINKKQVKLPENITLIIIPFKKLPTASLRKFVWEQFQVPKFFKKNKVDLVHYPYPSNPKSDRRKKDPTLAPTLVTIHDTIPWERPEYRKKLRSRLYQNHSKKALKNADHIIAVSQTTAFTVTDHINYPFNKITVIHEAASPVFSKRTQKFKNANPFFLYVGGYDERKNVIRMVQVFQEYIAPNYAIDLILVGAKNQGNNHYSELEKLQDVIKRNKINSPPQKSGKIITTGWLSSEKLAQYYAGCLGFLNISHAEGFNIPLLEAASGGAPIITSDLAVHQEIIGKNGLFCDPKNSKVIGETLLNFIRDKELQTTLRNASANLREQYSWSKAANETLKLYKSLF